MVQAITNIVLGTRYPNGFHTKKSLVSLARTFITPLGDFQTPFLKEVDRSDSTSVHQYIPRMFSASSVKHGSMATKFQAVFSMMLFRTWFAAFTLGGWFHQSKLLRASRTNKNRVSCTSTGFLCRPVLQKQMVEATIPLWQKTPSTHDTRQLWQPPTAVRAMMRNESIKTKSFSYSLEKLQQTTRITLPCDESFVPNRSKLFGSIFFVWATLGLRLFRFYHRNSEMYGLCWTLLDSCWTRVQHPKSLSYVQTMQNKFSHVGLCWTESNIPNHYLTSANFGLTPFRLL